MVTLTHSSPLGALEIPGVVGRPVPGEPFDVPEEIAASLLTQTDLYQQVKRNARRSAEEAS